MVSTDPVIVVSAILTICMLTYLIKVNPLFHFAERTLVSSAVGNLFVTGVIVISTQAVAPLLNGNVLQIIPLLFGVSLLFRLSDKYSWVSRYGTSFMVGTGNALLLRAILKSDVITQIQATYFSLLDGPFTVFNNFVLASAVVSSVFYFVFTIPQFNQMKGANSVIKYARIVMLIGFSFNYASTITTRIGSAYEALKLVYQDFLGLYFA